uniref:Uncharacterized protein n=1 Tax=Pseudonocardia tetrahydrofuranoxydans TaxID=102884 RepID=Q9F3V5_9PSEU|nr:hypothetical protein [Pseudonocardia tetrahydrofuranoxydans]
MSRPGRLPLLIWQPAGAWHMTLTESSDEWSQVRKVASRWEPST